MFFSTAAESSYPSYPNASLPGKVMCYREVENRERERERERERVRGGERDREELGERRVRLLFLKPHSPYLTLKET